MIQGLANVAFGWPQTHRDMPTSASKVLKSKLFAIIPGQVFCLVGWIFGFAFKMSKDESR